MPGVISVQPKTPTTCIVEAISWERKINSIEIPMSNSDFLEAYGKWQGINNRPRVLVQDAFPSLTPVQREFIMTGTTEEEWDEMFPKDE